MPDTTRGPSTAPRASQPAAEAIATAVANAVDRATKNGVVAAQIHPQRHIPPSINETHPDCPRSRVEEALTALLGPPPALRDAGGLLLLLADCRALAGVCQAGNARAGSGERHDFYSI